MRPRGFVERRRGGPEFDSREGFRDFIGYNIEAEAGFDEALAAILKAWTTDELFSDRGGN